MDEAQRSWEETGDAQQRFIAAYNNYMQALQAAWAREDLQQRGAEAYQAYMQVLQEAWPEELQRRAQAAYQAYVQVFQEAMAPVDVQQRAAEAYREYVRATQEAWAQVDIRTLDLNTITAIIQSMMAVAWMAGAANPGTVGPPGTMGTSTVL